MTRIWSGWIVLLLLAVGVYAQQGQNVPALVPTNRLVDVEKALADLQERLGDKQQFPELTAITPEKIYWDTDICARHLPWIADRVRALHTDLSPHVRSRVIFVYARSSDPRAVEGLIDLLQDADREVRYEAIRALVGKDDPRVIPALREMVTDTDHSVRYIAASELGKRQDTVSLPVLRKLFGERHIGAIVAVGELRDAQSVSPLIKLYLDPKEERINAAVASSLAKIGKPAVEPLLKELRNGHTSVVAVLNRIDDPRCGEVVTLLRSSRPELAAVSAMKYLQPQDAAPVLVAALESPRGGGFGLLRTIGETRIAEFVDVIEPYLTHQFYYTRASAAYALGKIKGQRAVSLLEPMLADESPDVRKMAISALVACNDRTADAVLLRALPTLTSDVQPYALRGLAQSSDAQVMKQVIAWVEAQPESTNNGKTSNTVVFIEKMVGTKNPEAIQWLMKIVSETSNLHHLCRARLFGHGFRSCRCLS